MKLKLKNLSQRLNSIPDFEIIGKVSSIKGLSIEVSGISDFACIGSRCLIESRSGKEIRAEVIGFRDSTTLLMPYEDLSGVGSGCSVKLQGENTEIFPTNEWLGRIINSFAEPIDDKGHLPNGIEPFYLKASPPPAQQRTRVKDKLDMGVRAINLFTTCCKGQRLGVFAGSGVGKSVLISMFTRFAKADVKVIGLIGERGREVQEFIEDYLGEEGLKNAVIIVATSDESALSRKQAAYLTIAVSEYFRNQDKQVLTMIDSITRFAMAQREIGLAAGEPPTSKGYPPSVFSELPKLLERAGPGTKDQGAITGLFSVLVEGDDTNEPIADTVRSILDGHIVLDRNIASRGRFPAVDILSSISRTMPMCNSEEENVLVNKARSIISSYEDMADMIRIGAYKTGTDPDLDYAIKIYPEIERYLSQAPNENDDFSNSYAKMAEILK